MNTLVSRSMPLPRGPESELAAKVLFLAEPRNYPEATGRVDTIETHMSWVFLTDRHAWKLKKPVRQSYLDFSTEAARRHYCAEEVRLNRRLTHGRLSRNRAVDRRRGRAVAARTAAAPWSTGW